MRTIEIISPFDVPRTLTGWKIIGDSVEARFSYLRRAKIYGNIGMGFTWLSAETKKSHSVSLVWQALEKHVLTRIIDAPNVTRTRLLESSIVPNVNTSARLKLVIEGD